MLARKNSVITIKYSYAIINHSGRYLQESAGIDEMGASAMGNVLATLVLIGVLWPQPVFPHAPH
jgi:hypothetical protein